MNKAQKITRNSSCSFTLALVDTEESVGGTNVVWKDTDMLLSDMDTHGFRIQGPVTDQDQTSELSNQIFFCHMREQMLVVNVLLPIPKSKHLKRYLLKLRNMIVPTLPLKHTLSRNRTPA
ncbi:unnamed protein product [Ectocarpus sp. 12 AP-2014]